MTRLQSKFLSGRGPAASKHESWGSMAALFGVVALLRLLPSCTVGRPTPLPPPRNCAGSAHGAECGSPRLEEARAADSLFVDDALRGRRAKERILGILRTLASSPRIALGHQDTTAYGVGWSGDASRSDVASLCGAYPAVYGWDAFGVERGEPANGDGVMFDRMRTLIRQAHARGGINTMSWHCANPATGGDAWDTTAAAAAILPAEPLHERLRAYLGRLGDFLASLRDARGEPIPILLRPYHEHNEGWFWWGGPHVSDDDFIALWRFTVEYLRNERGLEQLLFAFSPGAGKIDSQQAYLWRFPGDEYVDVMGIDYYYGDGSEQLVRAVRAAVAAASSHGKVAALTEFGIINGLSNSMVQVEDWYTRAFLEPLAASGDGLELAYALLWRNARASHAFVPYGSHRAAANFRALCADSRVVLESELAHDASCATPGACPGLSREGTKAAWPGGLPRPPHPP